MIAASRKIVSLPVLEVRSKFIRKRRTTGFFGCRP